MMIKQAVLLLILALAVSHVSALTIVHRHCSVNDGFEPPWMYDPPPNQPLWYKQVRYTDLIAVDRVVGIETYSRSDLPDCSFPYVYEIEVSRSWKEKVGETILIVGDLGHEDREYEREGRPAPGAEVLVYAWRKNRVPHPVAFIRRTNYMETELEYLEDSFFQSFEIK